MLLYADGMTARVAKFLESTEMDHLVRFLKTSRVSLYVNSSKKAVGTEEVVIDRPTVQIMSSDPGIAIPPRVYNTREVRTVTKYDYVLPEQQERAVEIVREVASKDGFQLEVIDVTQRDLFDEALPKEAKNLKNLPVLMTESGLQLTGNFSRQDVEECLSKEMDRQNSRSEP